MKFFGKNSFSLTAGAGLCCPPAAHAMVTRKTNVSADFMKSPWGRMVFSGALGTCGWRIVISPKIPQDSPSCYDSVMRDLVVLFIHLIATLARLLGPGGARSIVAESLLLKHQLLMVNRPRHRSP